MQQFNIIDFIYIVDLALLNFIDYLEVIEDKYVFNEKNQLQLNISSKNKKILTELILSNIDNNLQYGKHNIIINTCKPMQNWRQDMRGTAVRSYKYKCVDTSISFDILRFNQFIDKLFSKLPNFKFDKFLNSDVTYINNFNLKHSIFYMEYEDVDIYDIVHILERLLSPLGKINNNITNYNNILITDGNYEYTHGLYCPDEIISKIRRNLIEKGIL